MGDPILFHGLTDAQAQATAAFHQKLGATVDIITTGPHPLTVRVVYPDPTAPQAPGPTSPPNPGPVPTSGVTLRDVSQLPSGSISAETLGGEKGLAIEVQQRLSDCGLLDPPADGVMGAVSLWALGEFCKAKNLPFDLDLTPAAATALLNETGSGIFPIIAKTDFAGKVVNALQRKGYWIARHPSCFNIVYIEGMNPDGTPNSDAPNIFDDLRMLMQIDAAGNSRIAASWEGTVKPSTVWTMHPMDPRGAARIAFGQYKSWCVGIHHPGKSTAHEALVQSAPITIFRDTNKTFRREGRTYTGLFAINQHWGYNAPKGDLGNTSAGCLVGRLEDGHRQFMSMIKSDPRYEANTGYRFMSAVLSAQDII